LKFHTKGLKVEKNQPQTALRGLKKKTEVWKKPIKGGKVKI